MNVSNDIFTNEIGEVVKICVVVIGPNPRKNSRAAVAYLTPKRTMAWWSRLSLAVAETQSLRGVLPLHLARRGRWSITIDVYEDELRHLDIDIPLGDIDSTVTAVLDGLQPKRCGPWAPLDDDARVVEATVRKHYDPDSPRVEIALERLPPLHIEPRKTHRRKPVRPRRKTP